MYGIPEKMTENFSERSDCPWQSNNTHFVASQSYRSAQTALNVAVVGRGYLGTLISRSLSVGPPVSLSSKIPVERRDQTVVIASGPSSVSVTESELQNWRGYLRRWLMAHRQHRANSKVIYLSSAGTVYGECGAKVADENYPLNPTNGYGNYHCWAENEILNLYGDNATILRLSNLYGPNQLTKKGQGFVSACMRAALQDDYLSIFGDGLLIRDYIFEDDLVGIVRMLIEHPIEGTFNVASGISHSVTEVINEVENCMRKKIKLKRLPKRPEDINCIRLSNKKLLRALGIKKLTSLRDGVESYGAIL